MGLYLKFLWLALCLLLSLASAQSWQPKCTEILKLEPQKFVQIYLEKNTYRGDSRPESEIIAIWTNCQRASNNTKLKNNPKLMARIESLRRLETTFFDAQFFFALIDGGYSSITGSAGSVIQTQQNFFEPYLEYHLGVVIGLALSKSGAVTSSSIKARHAKAATSLEAEVRQKSLGADKNVDPETIKNLPIDLKNYVQNWENAALQFRGAYAEIYQLVGQPADITSTTILEFLALGYY